MKQQNHIIVAGNIGAGKSTLVEYLARATGWEPYYEPVQENPYLEEFYQQMSQWAFHSQMYFLTNRVSSHRALGNQGKSVIQDRSLYEDAEIFARNLFQQGIMTKRDWETYYHLYQQVKTLLPLPNGAIYIRASVDTLSTRIRNRGREFEQSIPLDYLSQLNDLYESWISNFDLCPLVVLPGDLVDFVSDPKALEPYIHELFDSLEA